MNGNIPVQDRKINKPADRRVSVIRKVRKTLRSLTKK